MTADLADPMQRELVFTRRFQAPRALVFKAWTDPVFLARWWGPRGFTNPVCEADARPGGALKIVMRAHYGTDYPMRGVFLEVTPPERLVFTTQALDNDGRVVLEGWNEVVLKEAGDATDLTLTARATAMVPEAAAYLEGMEPGWSQSLDKLAAEWG